MSAPAFSFTGAQLDRSKVDFTSGTWEGVTQYVAARIEECRVRMEDLSLPEQERRDYAARIAELRELIGKEHVAPLKPATPVDYSR